MHIKKLLLYIAQDKMVKLLNYLLRKYLYFVFVARPSKCRLCVIVVNN